MHGMQSILFLNASWILMIIERMRELLNWKQRTSGSGKHCISMLEEIFAETYRDDPSIGIIRELALEAK